MWGGDGHELTDCDLQAAGRQQHEDADKEREARAASALYSGSAVEEGDEAEDDDEEQEEEEDGASDGSD
jgi:hypothetical protein